jgi:hypothetical protein
VVTSLVRNETPLGLAVDGSNKSFAVNLVDADDKNSPDLDTYTSFSKYVVTFLLEVMKYLPGACSAVVLRVQY